MRYLVLVALSNGFFTAQLFDRNNENRFLFDLLEVKTQDLPTLASDNYTSHAQGKLSADNIEDIEPVMRLIGFRKCDVCGAWVTPQDIRNGHSTYVNRIRKCPLCIAKEQGKRMRKNGYHATSHLVRVINGDGENFDLSNVLGIGIEVEYWNPNECSDYLKCTNAFYDIANENCANPLFRVERDGSCSGEMISNVFTKKALYAFNFELLTDMLKLNGNVDGNTHAGLHVHLSKLWLGTNPREQVLNYLKLQYFMKSYENDFLKLSGRRRENMYYCQFFSHSEIERMKAYIERYGDDAWDYMPDDHGGGDGCALNSSGATIEFRIGANTNDPVRMRNYILFILGITENIKNVPFSKCYCIGKVTKLVPADVMAYWRRQGCFLTTNAIDQRGVTL